MSKILIEEATVKQVMDACEGIANADWRKWNELASLAEFERWAKSRANFMATILREALAEQPAQQSCYCPNCEALGKELAALKAQQQEPVAWMRHDGARVVTQADRKHYPAYETRYPTPLYTSPPAQRKSITGWIAVSDRIPLESDGEVLVRMRDGRCEIAWATYWHGASNAFAQWTFRDPDEDEAPTHWMHIPTIEAYHGITKGGAA